jgi:hypothetical protein
MHLYACHALDFVGANGYDLRAETKEPAYVDLYGLNLAVRPPYDFGNLPDALVIRTVNRHPNPSRQVLNLPKALSQRSNDGLARWGQRVSFLSNALSDVILLTAERSYLVPAVLCTPFDCALNIASDPLQCGPTSATEPVLVGAHAQGKPTFTRRNLATKRLDIGSARRLERLNRISHAISKFALRTSAWCVAPQFTIIGHLDVRRFAIPGSGCLLAQQRQRGGYERRRHESGPLHWMSPLWPK